MSSVHGCRPRDKIVRAPTSPEEESMYKTVLIVGTGKGCFLKSDAGRRK